MTDRQKAMHDFSLHQDTLLWSRVQTLIAIQSGTLAGTYFLQSSNRPMAIVLMCLGIALTLLLFFIMLHDQIARDQASDDSGVPWTKWARRWYAPLSGGESMCLVYLLLVAADISLLAWVAT